MTEPLDPATAPDPILSPVQPASRRTEDNIRFGVTAAVIVALVAGALSIAALRTPHSVSLVSDGSGGVSVSGTATVHAVPDMATVSIGVSTSAPTIKEARATSAAKTEQVITALRAAGVAEADITTTNVSLYEQQPQTPYGDPYGKPLTCDDPRPILDDGENEPPVDGVAPDEPVSGNGSGSSGAEAPGASRPSFTGVCMAEPWVYSLDLSVVIRDLDDAGDIIDSAIAAGATNVSGLSFDVSNRAELESVARTDAIEAAKVQAESMAKAAGASIGAPTSISSSFYGNYPAADGRVGIAGGKVETPVMPGTMDITATVSITFSLE